MLVAAGLLAQNAVAKGLTSKPWVKTSLAPGSKVVTQYLKDSGLMPALEALRFHVVGYGCTTCIGNSGPLPDTISKTIQDNELVAVSVLSGNRNFEGRISPDVRANYLGSPPLVVAYALAGRIDIDFDTEPLGIGSDGKPVFLRDVWPAPDVVAKTVGTYVTSALFQKQYAERLSRRRPLARAARSTRRPLRLGREEHLRPPPHLLRRHPAAAGAARRHP